MSVGNSANVATVCKNCGERTTRHPSGLCARCQRKAGAPIVICECCGQRKTRDESKLCYVCRAKQITKNYDVSRIDYAIEQTKLQLAILEKKRDGYSIRKIAEELGIPKSTVDNTYKQAVFSKLRSINNLDIWQQEQYEEPDKNNSK